MDEEEVSSELITEDDYSSSSSPIYEKHKSIVSQFKFKLPPVSHQIDADGDLIICRRSHDQYKEIIEIEHRKSTNLQLVGLQLWRGALLLADWLIYNQNNYKNDCILELGAGVGFTSIVASMFVPVYCTDKNISGLFNLIKSNIVRNKRIIKNSIDIMELDFMFEKLPENIINILSKVTIIVAADVVYDDSITTAFIKTIGILLSQSPQKKVIIALEKRYVFTLTDCDAVAPCYDYFLKCLKKYLNNVHYNEIPLTFPQYFQYKRTKEMIMWELTTNFQ